MTTAHATERQTAFFGTLLNEASDRDPRLCGITGGADDHYPDRAAREARLSEYRDELIAELRCVDLSTHSMDTASVLIGALKESGVPGAVAALRMTLSGEAEGLSTLKRKSLAWGWARRELRYAN